VSNVATDEAVAGALVVIGNFDGVHRGHQAVLGAVARLARQRGLRPRMLTFEPHPAVTLGREPPPLLTTLERKRELVEQACPGIDVVVRAFTHEFAQQTPAEFAERVLSHELGAKLVMVGVNFRFGRDRSGGIAELDELAGRHGFEVVAEPLVSDAAGPWSSTRVRQLVAAGAVDEALEILGRPHMLSGHVARGDQRGRTLGFPTCNIADAPEARPAHGVYAVLVDRVEDGRARALAKGVANIGVRPTVATGGGALLEVHLFDIDEDLYGATLRVHFVARLRGEQRFAGLDELRRQIAHDSSEARRILREHAPDPAVDGAWA
jgi:riboflavin kinase/FMN adenylyltransferase